MNSTRPFVRSLKKLSNIILDYLFAFYKVGLRPIFGNACKFHPTCSCYAHEAYKKHNFLKATYLSTYRLLRCHPFSEGGLDPVPEYNKEALNG